MARKQRIDSATAAVKVMQGAVSSELMPPAHAALNEAALPFWREIVRGRAREEWEGTPALMATAASLAWTQWQVSKLRAAIEVEETPDAKAVQRVSDLQRLEMGYLRVLQQHGRAAQGEARDVKSRREVATGITSDNPLGDDLIARPTVN